jgi:hypothetical protein
VRARVYVGVGLITACAQNQLEVDNE